MKLFLSLSPRSHPYSFLPFFSVFLWTGSCSIVHMRRTWACDDPPAAASRVLGWHLCVVIAGLESSTLLAHWVSAPASDSRLYLGLLLRLTHSGRRHQRSHFLSTESETRLDVVWDWAPYKHSSRACRGSWKALNRNNPLWCFAYLWFGSTWIADWWDSWASNPSITVFFLILICELISVGYLCNCSCICRCVCVFYICTCCVCMYSVFVW